VYLLHSSIADKAKRISLGN